VAQLALEVFVVHVDEDIEIPVTFSRGVASISPELQDPHDFIRGADTKFYEAKSRRNRAVDSG
jgi:PleD family two-component response regulator